MAIQFVRVIYPSARKVNVDHLELGDTGELLKMDAGHRIFDLGAPLDYSPGSQTVRVGGTSKNNPKLVIFTPMVMVVAAEAEELPTPRLKTAKRVGVKGTSATAKRAAKTARPKVAKKAPKKAAKKKVKTAVKTAAEKRAKKSVRKLANKSVTKPARKIANKAAKKSSK